MAGNYLTKNATIMCPHGGTVSLSTKNSDVSAVNGNILLESDKHSVSGCLFTLPGGKPSPCIEVEWKAGTTKATINGTKILTKTSVGLCKSGEGAPQGTAIIASTQPKAEGQ